MLKIKALILLSSIIIIVAIVAIVVVDKTTFKKTFEPFINNDLTGLWKCEALYSGTITLKQFDTIVKGYYSSEEEGKEELIGIINNERIKLYIVQTEVKLNGRLIKTNGVIDTIQLSNGLSLTKVVRKQTKPKILGKLDVPNLSGKWLESTMKSDVIELEQSGNTIFGYYKDIEFGSGEIINNKIIFNYNFLNNSSEFNDSSEKKIIGSIELKSDVPNKIKWQNGDTWNIIPQYINIAGYWEGDGLSSGPIIINQYNNYIEALYPRFGQLVGEIIENKIKATWKSSQVTLTGTIQATNRKADKIIWDTNMEWTYLN